MGDDMIQSPQQILNTNLAAIENLNNILIYHRNALRKGVQLQVQYQNQDVMNQIMDLLLAQGWKIDYDNLTLFISM